MPNSSDRQTLPIGTALVFLVGVVLILIGVIVQFAGKPELGGPGFWLYELSMGGGGLCMLLGAWLSWRWRKAERTHTDGRN